MFHECLVPNNYPQLDSIWPDFFHSPTNLLSESYASQLSPAEDK